MNSFRANTATGDLDGSYIEIVCTLETKVISGS